MVLGMAVLLPRSGFESGFGCGWKLGSGSGFRSGWEFESGFGSGSG